MKKRIIKKHMKNGLSRNSLERLNREYKSRINWLERSSDSYEKQVDDMMTDYIQLTQTYREDMSYYIEKVKSREKINDGLKNTIEKLMQERYDEREASTRLMQELDQEIRELTKDINIKGMLEMTRLDAIYDEKDIRIITPEEYKEKYEEM